MPALQHDLPPTRVAGLLPRMTVVPASLAGLLDATSEDERRNAIQQMLLSVGCDWLAFGALVPTGEGARLLSICTSHIDPNWIRRYCAEAYADIDPRLAQATRTSLPVSWTIEQITACADRTPPASRTRRFAADLAATGMRGGTVLVLPGEPEGRRHFISLLAREPDRRLLAGELVGQVLTLSLGLHEYYTRTDQSAEQFDPTASLTPIQREILGHVVRGESDKRIASHLRISAHAVDYHMRQLRSRFAVRNRVQLVQASRTFINV